VSKRSSSPELTRAVRGSPATNDLRKAGRETGLHRLARRSHRAKQLDAHGLRGGDRIVDPHKVDLALCGMALEKNGEIECTGAGAAALGHPLNCVAWLANTLGRLGIGLKAGEIILSGSLGKLVPVARGDQLRVTIGGIGTASVRFQ